MLWLCVLFARCLGTVTAQHATSAEFTCLICRVDVPPDPRNRGFLQPLHWTHFRFHVRCNICSAEFHTKRSFRRHVRAHKAPPFVVRDPCNTESESDESYHGTRVYTSSRYPSRTGQAQLPSTPSTSGEQLPPPGDHVTNDPRSLSRLLM